ncbi:hypothetical protein ABIB48_002636 [Arthrobacter sp. UYCu511]|uniref:hypothetical protein n=1 Tax=Arthrobacter sp. UYCu511 TaxID=3156337 RepID=UPI00339394CB
MSNRRKDRPVPAGFTRYNGQYDKAFYTIITFNGVTYEGVWPNAGLFGISRGLYLNGSQVFAVKKEVQS